MATTMATTMLVVPQNLDGFINGPVAGVSKLCMARQFSITVVDASFMWYRLYSLMDLSTILSTISAIGMMNLEFESTA